jgi:hypothetical protein
VPVEVLTYKPAPDLFSRSSSNSCSNTCSSHDLLTSSTAHDLQSVFVRVVSPVCVVLTQYAHAKLVHVVLTQCMRMQNLYMLHVSQVVGVTLAAAACLIMDYVSVHYTNYYHTFIAQCAVYSVECSTVLSC